MTSNKVLVVVAHPDDEVLGCGATIAKHAAARDEVHIMIMADGVSSRKRSGKAETKLVSTRRLQAKQAADILGANKVIFFDFPDNEMDAVPLLEVVVEIETHVKSFKPNIVYTHHRGDLNIDHRQVYQAVVTACRPVHGSSVRKMFSFEVPSSTEWCPASADNVFMPDYYSSVSEFMEIKLRALSEYVGEVFDQRHPRSLEYCRQQAYLRGTSVGLIAAEAFSTIRVIE